MFSACKTPASVTPKALAEDENACYQFVKNHMLSDGGMITNYHEKPYSTELATGNEVLSESQGLLLNYTAEIADRAVFDEVYKYTKDYLDTGKIFAYRYNPGGEDVKGYSMNAAVDDLRIVKALFNAGEVFSDRSLTRAAKTYSGRLYKSNVENDQLYDFYDAQLYMKNSFITLCYLDLEAIEMIAGRDRRYGAVYENALKTLEGGYISDEFPMFMTKYDYVKGKYEAPKGINMVEAVLTALNLSYAGRCPDTTTDFLKAELSKGRIYTKYDVSGRVTDKLESTALYALCALLAIETGDRQMYESSIALMKKFMVTKKEDILYGAFGDEKNVYSFDNLMALTAFRKGVQ